MARPTRYNPHKSLGRRYWIYGGVVAFLLVDVILVLLALGLPPDPATVSTARPLPQVSDGVATPTPTPSSAASSVAIPSTRLLGAVDAKTVWRATTGECPTAAATPELSTDSGVSWRATDATGDVQITALQGIRAVSNAELELVGLSSADCTPQFSKTFVAGDDYSNYPKQLQSQWYVDPADRSTVHTPAGAVAAPCPAVVALAPSPTANDAAGVLCGDVDVFITRDSGATWGNPVHVLGAVNVAVTPMGYVVARVGVPECAGVQLEAISGESLVVAPIGCLLTETSVEAMQGNVALAEAGGVIWLWVGNSVVRSSDQGASWQDTAAIGGT